MPALKEKDRIVKRGLSNVVEEEGQPWNLGIGEHWNKLQSAEAEVV